MGFDLEESFKNLFAPQTPYQYSGPNMSNIDTYHE